MHVLEIEKKRGDGDRPEEGTHSFSSALQSSEEDVSLFDARTTDVYYVDPFSLQARSRDEKRVPRLYLAATPQKFQTFLT